MICLKNEKFAMKLLTQLIGLFICFVASHAQEQAYLFFPAENEPAKFAANEIYNALAESSTTLQQTTDYTLLSQKTGLKIVLSNVDNSSAQDVYTNDGGLSVGTLSEQGYAIRRTGLNGNITYWVFGGDRAGIMYGGLRLAEIIQLQGLKSVQEEQDAPFIKQRGLKFNISLDVRTPSFADGGPGSNGDMNREYVWDLEFWKDWLDDAARYRYNFLSLWSRHPFPSLIKLDNYPEAAMDDVYNSYGLVKKMSIDDKIAMWQAVIEHANNRCIDVTWITWNIFLDYVKDVSDLKESGLDEETKKYFRECTATLLRTYPGLRGIGITSGERMRELETAESKEEWVFDTYGRGVMAVANEQPDREILFIHRYWWTSFDNIISHFQPLIDQPNVQFDMSFKYAKARMYAAPNPIFAKETVLTTLPEGLRSWWNIRNDDILIFRWGNPDYARSFILNLPPENQTAGYHMGSDRYIWGRETVLRDHETPRQLQTQFNWYKFMIWGRMGYNPSTPNSLFVSHIKNRYSDVNSLILFNAWQAASQSLPLATKFHWHDWDYMWHVETCSGYDEKSGLNLTKRFYDVLSFIDNPTMAGSGLMKISDYAKAVVDGNPPTINTPLTHARLMEQFSNTALAELSNVGNSSNKETESIKEDIRAMANAGLYYAHKIEAATYHALFEATNDKKYKTLAIQHMLRSYKAWEKYIDIFRTQYNPGNMSIIDRAVDFDELLQCVQNDVKLVGGNYKDKIENIELY